MPRRNRSRKIETCSDGRVLGLHIPRNEDFIGKFPPREPGRVLVILPASILVLSFTAHPPPNSPSSSPAHLPTFWTTCSRCDPASGGWESRRQRAGQGGRWKEGGPGGVRGGGRGFICFSGPAGGWLRHALVVMVTFWALPRRGIGGVLPLQTTRDPDILPGDLPYKRNIPKWSNRGQTLDFPSFF